MRSLIAGAIGVSLAVTLLASGDPDGKRWWSTVEALANDSMRGRNTGTAEHRKAAEYVIAQFEHSGLKAAGSQGFMQPVPFTGRAIVEAQSSLELIRNANGARPQWKRDSFFRRFATQ